MHTGPNPVPMWHIQPVKLFQEMWEADNELIRDSSNERG
jgi:hypothetical protein